MMLEALVALAERKGLLDDPSFGKRTVHFQLRITDDGVPVALIHLGEEGRGTQMEVPVPPKRSSGIRPAFLVDNAQYVLGIPKRKKGEEPTARAIARAGECVSAFLDDIREAATGTDDPGLRAVQRFLEWLQGDPEGGRTRITSMAPEARWTGDECIAIARDADGTTYVHEREAVCAYWAAKRSRKSKAGKVQRCLVTGAWEPTTRLHGSIKRIPNAQTSGASLVSFNAPAFTSHQLDQGENAPVSQRGVDGYVRALNWLLDKEGEHRFRCGIPIGKDSVLVFWTREENDTTDVLLSLFAPEAESEDDLRSTFRAAWKGLAPNSGDTTAFYAITLSGNASRVVVRDWIETTAAEVKANVRRYFEDLSLGSDDEPLSIRRMLRALEATPSADKDRHGLSPVLASRLFRAAINGSQFPREILHAALARLRVPPREREWRGTLRARVALIKATLLRLHPTLEVTVSLDETNSSVPYLLGRLFAAMEKLQGDALGNVNATLRDRYFGSASSTPALVFPQLLRVSMHHASKAKSDGRGWTERVKAQIVNSLPAAGAFPRTLGIEEQGLFAVGYYHQREAFFTRADHTSKGASQ